MEKTIVIPERVCDRNVEETYVWDRVNRMVYWLSNGRRDVERIAALLNKPEALIAHVVEGMATVGVLIKRTEQRPIILDAPSLTESFTMVTPIKELFAHRFYKRLFSDYPQETLPLFADTDMQRQESLLVATLAAVVSGVADGANLTPYLHSLGAKHARKSVRGEHYPLVGGVLLETFHETLGKRFTCAMERAWSDAFEVISTTMQEA